MSIYYVRDDGDDNNSGFSDAPCCAKKTVEAAKAICQEKDVIIKCDEEVPGLNDELPLYKAFVALGGGLFQDSSCYIP